MKKDELIKKYNELLGDFRKLECKNRELKEEVKELVESNRKVLERERTFMKNIIAQSYARKRVLSLSDGKEEVVFATPNLDHTDAYMTSRF